MVASVPRSEVISTVVTSPFLVMSTTLNWEKTNDKSWFILEPLRHLEKLWYPQDHRCSSAEMLDSVHSRTSCIAYDPPYEFCWPSCEQELRNRRCSDQSPISWVVQDIILVEKQRWICGVSSLGIGFSRFARQNSFSSFGLGFWMSNCPALTLPHSNHGADYEWWNWMHLLFCRPAYAYYTMQWNMIPWLQDTVNKLHPVYLVYQTFITCIKQIMNLDSSKILSEIDLGLGWFI